VGEEKKGGEKGSSSTSTSPNGEKERGVIESIDAGYEGENKEKRRLDFAIFKKKGRVYSRAFSP